MNRCISSAGSQEGLVRAAPNPFRGTVFTLVLAFSVPLAITASAGAENLFADPSFETPKDPDQFGNVFAKWGGWIYDPPARFAVGTVARTGKTSYEIIGDEGCKVRLQSPLMTLAPGRYRVQVFLRGLGIGKGRYGKPLDFSVGFDGKFFPFKKGGTFGWTPLTYVFDVPSQTQSFRLFVGLHAGGHLWIDDASLEKADPSAELTPEPVFGAEEAPVAAPGKPGRNALHCPDCAYLNNPDWKQCYACGRTLAGASSGFDSPPVRVIADFENGKTDPFVGGKITDANAPQGTKALFLEKEYSWIKQPQDWSQHDYLLFDVFNPSADAVTVSVEVRDVMTKGYWTRVNITTIVPPGASTVTIPTALYVGEKSRPGRSLLRDKITDLALGAGGKPMIFDNFHLERLDTSAVAFDGLLALDFGRLDSPVMEGFAPVIAGLTYAEGRGYGWQDAELWRSFDALQPDALYEDFVCPLNAVFRVDLPNGKYRVVMNIDSPGGFWGEVQRFKRRQVWANGTAVVDESTDFEGFKKRYFRNAAREDSPGIDAFKEYVEPMFQPKTFDVDVTDGKCELKFVADGFGVSLSCLVIYPADKAEQGKRFWDWVTARRRKQFNDYFKQILPNRAGLPAPAEDYRVFSRSFMNPVNAFDGPEEGEAIPAEGLSVAAAQGEEAPLTFSVQPSGDLGAIDLEFSPFVAEGGRKLPPEVLVGGWVDYRITRVTMDGTVYSVQPRYWRPLPAPAAPKVTRTFWIRVRIPEQTPPGRYVGKITVKPRSGAPRTIPTAIRVLPFPLEAITDTAAGPWGSGIDLPWYGEEEPTIQWRWRMFEKALDAIRDAGCTSFSGRPTLKAKAANGKIELDAAQADKEMALIRSKGFTQMISSYGVPASFGYKTYGVGSGPDEESAKAAGFTDAVSFLSAMYRAIDEHAAANNWLPVAWNICDEPVDAAIQAAAQNAMAHRKAAEGLKLTTFMGATSMTGTDPNNPHHALVRALPVASMNTHDEASIGAVKEAGNRFSFYNGGNRWTYGRYMKMLVVKHRMALRLTWHFNVVAGDPYYALDCREDDYCWFNSDAEQNMVPSVSFLAKILPGLNDYRYLSALQRLLKEKPDHPAAAEGRKVFDSMMDLVAGRDRAVGDQRRGARAVEYQQDRDAVIKAVEAMLTPGR